MEASKPGHPYGGGHPYDGGHPRPTLHWRPFPYCTQWLFSCCARWPFPYYAWWSLTEYLWERLAIFSQNIYLKGANLRRSTQLALLCTPPYSAMTEPLQATKHRQVVPCLQTQSNINFFLLNIVVAIPLADM